MMYFAVDDDSGVEDIVVVVQIESDPDIGEEVLAEIARKIWCTVHSKAGVRAVPRRVLVSCT